MTVLVTQLSEVVNKDLNFSGQFKIVSASQQGSVLILNEWRQAGADSVLSAQVNRIGYNQI